MCYRGVQVLENKLVGEEQRIQQLEKELEETIESGESADGRFEEVSMHLQNSVFPGEQTQYLKAN